ncbi:MAG TPA: BadF/BadG/BcrA/BcrD ATPase family protein [Pirellulaceae bacterium]|nr:BadF/BadG/BcrA/BcrD ATPase family protein [Pirellulaceae bacterium]
MKHGDLVLGVDGGGTKTVAWLAPREAADEANVLGRGKAGPSNVRTVGFDPAIQNIDQAIRLAFEDAQLDRGSVASICIGLAGADRDAERVPLRAWAEQQQLAEHITVTNDAIPLIYVGSADGCGVALVAGTGSVAFGRNSEGQVARCGGWGPLFGDEGSGYAIAVAGLRAVAHASDGRGSATTLCDLFLQAFNVSNANELIPAIYSPHIDRPQIATYANLVFAADAAGDEVARYIIDKSAESLAAMIESVVRQLALTKRSVPLALTGGVILNQEAYRERLLRSLAARSVGIAPVTFVEHAVVGAIRMAVCNQA